MELLFFMLMSFIQIAGLCTTVYGIYICFKKSWALGLAGILVPGFAFVVGVAKLFKKDVLA